METNEEYLKNRLMDMHCGSCDWDGYIPFKDMKGPCPNCGAYDLYLNDEDEEDEE